jgi:type I restriction enzyme S subunit
LGEIPEHWGVTFLKRYCDKITDGAHFSPKTEFEGKNYVSVKDVDEFGNIDLLNCKKINIEDFIDLQKNGCQPNFNDVLLTKDGTIGRAAVVKKSNDFVTLSSLGLITPNQNKLNSDFLRYYLVSEININQMFSMIAGAALTRLTIDKIKHLIITIPEYDEQLSIVNFLEIEISKYDTLIKVNDNQIERLKTYRQSLISEAVTGKIDVREWQIDNN